MDWGTVVAVLVAMAIFMGAVMVIFGTGGCVNEAGNVPVNC